MSKSVILGFFVLAIISLPLVNALTLSEDYYFPLYGEDANVILLKGTSYYVETSNPQETSGLQYYFDNISERIIPARYFSMFNMGNGNDNLWISAQNCNITITSFHVQYTSLGDVPNQRMAIVHRLSWINYTIEGAGTQLLDYGSLVREKNNSSSFVNGNTTVFIDGTPKQEGNGWNWTDKGLKITGATSHVSLQSQEIYHEPYPDSTTLLPSPLELLPLLIVGAIIGLVVILVVITLIRGRRAQE
jgi:hypothetical protein